MFTTFCNKKSSKTNIILLNVPLTKTSLIPLLHFHFQDSFQGERVNWFNPGFATRQECSSAILGPAHRPIFDQQLVTIPIPPTQGWTSAPAHPWKNINLNISKHLKTSQNIQPCTVFGEHSIHCSIYLVSSSPYYSSRQWSCGRLKVGVSQKRFFFHLVPTIHYTKRSVIPLSSTEDNPPFNGRQGGCWEGESASESSRKFLLAPRQLRSHRGSRAETWTMLRFVPGSLQCILGHYRLFL